MEGVPGGPALVFSLQTLRGVDQWMTDSPFSSSFSLSLKEVKIDNFLKKKSSSQNHGVIFLKYTKDRVALCIFLEGIIFFCSFSVIKQFVLCLLRSHTKIAKPDSEALVERHQACFRSSRAFQQVLPLLRASYCANSQARPGNRQIFSVKMEMETPQ